MPEEAPRLTSLAQRLLARVQELLPTTWLNGSAVTRIPGNLNLTIKGCDADNLMVLLSDVAISSGSACSSASPKPSHVLRAIGLSHEEAMQTVRIGVGRWTTVDDVDYAAHRICESADRLMDRKTRIEAATR
jgi:cysteine desulfurase